MTKFCRGCSQHLAVDSFPVCKRNPDGRQYRCRKCIASWQSDNAAYCRSAQLWYKYKITEADYNAMFTNQGGKCAVCGTANPGRRDANRLCVDYDHKTGKVRGLLCAPCNKGIGHLGDSIENLEYAIKYLRNYG